LLVIRQKYAQACDSFQQMQLAPHVPNPNATSRACRRTPNWLSRGSAPAIRAFFFAVSDGGQVSANWLWQNITLGYILDDFLVKSAPLEMK
jgi:hypothetical protein